MILSRSFSRVALFDSPTSFVEQNSSYLGKYYTFNLGPFIYRVTFHSSPEKENSFDISFRMVEIPSTEELHEHMLKTTGEDLSPVELNDLRYHLVTKDPYGKTKTGFEKQVFSHVIAIIKDFVEKFSPNCIYFTSSGESRTSLYKAMVKRFLSYAHIRDSINRNGSYGSWVVCFKSELSNDL